MDSGNALASSMKWAIRHGMALLYLRPLAGRGDAHAQLWFGEPTTQRLPDLQDEIRSRGEVVRGKGGTVVTSHRIARGILARPREFRNLEAALAMPRWLGRMYSAVGKRAFSDPFESPSLVGLEGRELARARALFKHRLSRAAVDRLRPDITDRAKMLSLDLPTRSEDGRVDVVGDYARRLSQEILALLFDIDVAEVADISADVDRVSRLIDLGVPFREFLRSGRSAARLDRWTDAQIARTTAGSTSIIGPSVAAMRAGELDPEQLRRSVNLLVVAGYTTTISAVASGIKLLIENPDALYVLRANPHLWPLAVDEVLRIAGPVMMMPRYSVRSATLGGFRTKPERPVYVTGVNTDPAQYECPHRFDVSRPNAGTHLAFGGGAHRCLGAVLAEAEIEIGLREFFAVWSDVDLIEAERSSAILVRSWERMVVQLPTPQQRPVHSTGVVR
ncbi:cytochrome P450 [Nocardia sp. NPDC050406]|uniref:cytochrome P450 n=1 Tax=Nocardia sp. NPDC050406 TaxID=3364318 RepID=UPI0037B6481E